MPSGSTATDRHPSSLGDRHAAPAVVAGRGPDRAVTRDVERSGQQAGNEAPVCGQHLVGADHREPAAQCHDDPRLHAGERVGQHDVLRDLDQRPAVRAVVPVHPKEIAGVGTVGIDPGDLFGLRRQTRRRIGELGDAGQRHPERPQMRHVPLVAVPVDDPALESWCHVSRCHVRSMFTAGCRPEVSGRPRRCRCCVPCSIPTVTPSRRTAAPAGALAVAQRHEDEGEGEGEGEGEDRSFGRRCQAAAA